MLPQNVWLLCTNFGKSCIKTFMFNTSFGTERTLVLLMLILSVGKVYLLIIIHLVSVSYFWKFLNRKNCRSENACCCLGNYDEHDLPYCIDRQGWIWVYGKSFSSWHTCGPKVLLVSKHLWRGRFLRKLESAI